MTCYLTCWEARSHAARQASTHLNFAPRPETCLETSTPKTAPHEISSVTPRPRDGLPIRQPVRNCLRHLIVFPPFNEFHGISACSLRSPDHVETRSPPSMGSSRPNSKVNITKSRKSSMGGRNPTPPPGGKPPGDGIGQRTMATLRI